MSRSAVIIKSCQNGLILNLDPDLPFEELSQAVGEKFRRSADFFKNAQVALTLRGRALTREQETRLVEEIVQNSSIQVLCLMEEDPKTQELYRRAVLASENQKQEEDRYFCRGTLRSGQVLETEHSVVVIGDVNPGAQVISKGSIVILGCCMGTLYAGAAGDKSCFAAALTLKPMQLRIADRMVRSAIVKRKDTGEYPVDPRIAYLQDGHLVTKPLTSEAVSEYLLPPPAAEP